MIRRILMAVTGSVIIAGGIFWAVRRSNAQAEPLQRPAVDGQLHFQTKLGSFKLIAVGDEPVKGTLTMSFTGSLLISGATSAYKVSGNLIKEYDNKKYNKVGYHGTGTLSIKGPLRSIEWFGSDMKADFNGRGQVRLYGDFDSNLQTGTYWTTDPKMVNVWSANSVMTIFVPPFGQSGPAGGVKPQSRTQFNANH